MSTPSTPSTQVAAAPVSAAQFSSASSAQPISASERVKDWKARLIWVGATLADLKARAEHIKTRTPATANAQQFQKKLLEDITKEMSILIGYKAELENLIRDGEEIHRIELIAAGQPLNGASK